MKFISVLIFLIIAWYHTYAQLIPQNRRTNWTNAGVKFKVDTVVSWKNILDFSADNTGSISCNTALTNALNSLGGSLGVIYFPSGTYLFNTSVQLPNNVIIKGKSSDSTHFIFNLGGTTADCIQIKGDVSATYDTVLDGGKKGSDTLTLLNATGFLKGDYIEFRADATGYMTSTWANNDLAQISKVIDKVGNKLIIESPLRWNYQNCANQRVYKISPKNTVGIECIKLSRIDSSANQSSLISIQYAHNVWIKGVESIKTTFAHIDISKSIHCEVTESYFHHAWSYGDGGRGYGIAIQASTSECLFQNNIFEHLRHSVLFQSGANGNVVGYNFSTDPYWEQGILPSNSAGELVLHGNFPHSNLLEGNIVDNIVVDVSHGINGPFNTLFRNRANNYGIFMSAGSGDSTNIVNNELLKTTVLFVSTYSVNGNGNFEYGNNHNGSTKPSGTVTPPDFTSYYLSATPTWFNTGTLPLIGYSNSLNSGNIPAKQRFNLSSNNRCSCPARINPSMVQSITAGEDKIRINCQGDSVQIGADALANYSYSWIPITTLSNPNSSKTYAKPTSTTFYYLSATNMTNGIVVKDTVLVNVVESNLKADAGIDKYRCSYDTIQITLGGNPTATGGIAPIEYLWTGVFLNSTNIANPKLLGYNLGDSKYQLTVKDKKGCAATDSVLVSVKTPPTLLLGFRDTILKKGNSITLSASGSDSFLWLPNKYFLTSSNQPTVISIPDSSITYIVYGKTAYGCTSTDTVRIVVTEVGAIHSNNSLKNDFNAFPIPASNIVQLNSYRQQFSYFIADEMGRKVFASSQENTVFTIDVKDLTLGNYTVYYIVNGKIIYSQKLQITK